MTAGQRLTLAEAESHIGNPLPVDHPDHDAFYDAPDDVLAEMASEAIRNFGR